MSRLSSEKNRDARNVSVDLRIPFVFCTIEALVLLAFAILMACLHVRHMELVGLGILATYLVTAGIATIVYTARYTRMRQNETASEQVGNDIYRLFRASVDIPYAVVNPEGTVRVINDALQNILGRTSPVCTIPLEDVCGDVGMSELIAEAHSREPLHAADIAAVSEMPPVAVGSGGGCNDRPLVVRLADGRRYRVESYLFRRTRDHYYFLLFRDVNDYLDLSEKTDRERTILAYIMLDNLQELTQFVRASYRETVSKVEEYLTKWVNEMGGMIREYDRDKYLAVFSAEMLERCVNNEFAILDEIMNIHVGDNSFPVSVSMGIADLDGSFRDRERAANNALETALQRGGNQVALQRRGVTGLIFFGGAHKILESNTSISSRVSAHLLDNRLQTCDNVLIMGHSDPDFDAIGSAVGLYRLCRSILARRNRTDIPVHIVTNMTCETFRICREQLRSLPEYDHVFMDKKQAEEQVKAKTILILTDVNNPAIFEAPNLLAMIGSDSGNTSNERDKREKNDTNTRLIAVIDHHRLPSELPFIPFLHYIETTKSSASEIVSEIFQQSDYAETLCKEEANLLLAGIMLDTHNFTRSAGRQTFDVTYYLYSRGAHTNVVREYFSESADDLRIAGDFDANIEVYKDIFSISHHVSQSEMPSAEDRIAAAKAADKMLTVRGIEASFTLLVTRQSIAISARSKGSINVQLVMEALGGGGHFDMAGAQIAAGVEEARVRLKDAIDEQFPQKK